MRFAKVLSQALIVWLTGAVVFWFAELLTVIAGLPYSWAYKKFQSKGVSGTEAVLSILSAGEISMAYVSYALVCLVSGIICAAAVYLLFGKGDKRKTAALLMSVQAASSLFIYTIFRLNIRHLPGLLSLKSLSVDTALVAVCAVVAYLSFKWFVTIDPQRVFAVFVSMIFAMNVFLTGDPVLLKAFEAGLASLRGGMISGVCGLICLGLFFLSKRVFLSIGPGSLDSAARPVFAACAVLLAAAGILLIMTGRQGEKGIGKGSSAGALKDKPNIVFIVMDTMRTDHLSCYGYEHATSPRIDSIAAEGSLFKKAVSPSSWTLPSHVSLFTGLMPFENPTGHVLPYLPKRIDTLAGILKENGYRTLGYSNNPWVSYFTGVSRGFDEFQVGWERDEGLYFYREVYLWLSDKAARNDPDLSVKDHGAAKTTRYVAEWIKRNSSTPFFIFVNYMETHLPYDAPPPHKLMYKPDGVSNGEMQKYAPNPEDIRTLVVQRQRDRKELSVLSALYDGSINYLDGEIWRVYERLRDLQILDNTLLIITSDHGENLGEHGIVGHSYGLFSTLIDVPLIIRYPKYFTPGSIIDAPVQTTDIFYTIMDAAGIQRNSSMLGLSCSLARRVREKKYEDIMISERDTPVGILGWAKKEGVNLNHLEKDQKAVIVGRYKYVGTSLGEEELYDLVNDPGESNNIIGEKKETAIALRNMLGTLANKARHAGAVRDRPEMDKETKERLKSLGYVN